MDLSRVQLLPLAIGASFWALALLIIWLRPERKVAQWREEDFAQWKAIRGKPEATFAEFLGSEEAPRSYLSRTALSVVVTALALLALHSALLSWSVIS
ncbi:hypothetical protein [Piscinibacter defluvii]|uniref:hypothetical protein n=1 Tax=Piscinibacter defluvii TaxID=1796922 RepID=UPI000FDEAEFE|nr:hypothetical protein [Piscinibacter defluvii]